MPNRHAEKTIQTEKLSPVLDKYPKKSVSTSGAIQSKVAQSQNTKDASILVVGYSPTGGGHTARTLNIVDKALKNGDLKKDSTLVLHVPSKWMKNDPPQQLVELTLAAQKKGVNVIVAEATKSVHGFLHDDGSSHDPEILNHLSKNALRNDANISKLEDAEFYAATADGTELAKRELNPDDSRDLVKRNKDDFKNLKSIDAKDLMNSLSDMLGGDMSKVRVLTDMDPALQKAAEQAGVPGSNRVDQQNHAILLDYENPSPAKPKDALLSKVLIGKGEMVAHIDLGGKNSLGKLEPVLKELKLDSPENGQWKTKIDARNAVVEYIIKNGKVQKPKEKGEEKVVGEIKDANANADENGINSADIPTIREVGGQQRGVLYHESIEKAEQIKNVIYIYAHKNQDKIAEHIQSELGSDNVKPEYKETMFIFCGKDAIHTEKDGAVVNGIDAMSLGYVADGDAMTTMGAGTNGEYAYLREKAGSTAGMLSFAIQGHDEQMKNEEVLNKKYPDDVDMNNNDFPLGDYIDQYVKKRHVAADKKYKDKTMEDMSVAIKEASYVDAANDLLFGRVKDRTESRKKIENAEREMDTPEIRANRKYIKVMFQACEGICKAIDKSGENNEIEMKDVQFDIRVTKKEDCQSFSVDALRGSIGSTEGIVEIITQKNRTGSGRQDYVDEDTRKRIVDAEKASDTRKEEMKGMKFDENKFTMLKESKTFLDEISNSMASTADLKADLKIFRTWQEAEKGVDMNRELKQLKTDVFQKMVAFQIAIGKETTTGF